MSTNQPPTPKEKERIAWSVWKDAQRTHQERPTPATYLALEFACAAFRVANAVRRDADLAIKHNRNTVEVSS